ncbi:MULTISPECIES: DUF2785 domain-containing protein [Lysinibacillus]|jgi:hypothetical protein|uniref:DUF2785 domain-containing protein n=1 Tax=Lysinibacillus fusiformis TaxID=28031 RepID=A0A2I0UXS5_9BACI|nr:MULTISPECIES: DUF2785 domain-containing protein [Lysinibacillus]MEE3809184.1 DUF2785 domain-containing protein [Lysinibacillus fusiformis]PKU50878.1 DUF2785 domain-containing protein [Lysinibacillus fusiformis]WCH49554.1 DUF2785 domain-containing protein [Lysinibacillus sp. OF-1]SCY12844.1 Protein of unknown function [Lysinibacillus sp. SG9]SDB12077.1 Protein of unknown function [Lysinibacillus sp. TC-37]
MKLKKELIFLKNNEYSIPKSSNVENLIEQMLDKIGSVDGELRDDLIYTTFSNWILNDYLSVNVLQRLLDTILDEQHLFYGIGQSNSDSVFTRSFSMLLIPLILMADQKKNFLHDKDILEIKEKIIRYLQCEKDLRGYVPEKGWAHALAHAADALNELAKYDLPIAEKQQILDVIKSVISTKTINYTNLEDERLITAVITILKKNTFNIELLESWVNSFTDWEKTEIWHEEYKIISNVKNFLGSLYFRLEQEANQKYVAEIVKDKLIKMMKAYT